MGNHIIMKTLIALILLCSSALACEVPTDHIFSANSFWYALIPADAPLHPNSANFTAEFIRQKTAYYGNVNINTYSFAAPVYYADIDTPKTQVVEWNCQNKTYFPDASLKNYQWASVPVPSYALPANGSDAEMSIYDEKNDTLYDFWKMQKVDGKWQACWGGRIVGTSTNEGAYASYYGTTATSLPFIGGQITAEELQRGEIRHVIGISLVQLEKSSIYSWPAHRSDGYNPNNVPNRIPEGLRFRLDPAIDVDSLTMHPIGKIIAKAAQKYGFVVWDKAGAISIRTQNPLSYTAKGKPDPYVALWNGTSSYDILKGFPWSKLQFLPMNYGKP